MEAPLFIVWRESVEALFIIGVLYTFLVKNDLLHLRTKLWTGIALGLFLAILLAMAFWFLGEWFSGSAGEYFFIFMLFIASFLILHMTLWIHKNGSNFKQTLENNVRKELEKRSSGWSMMFLTLLAVGREGCETVVFLYGVGAQQTMHSIPMFFFGAVFGFCLALVTFYAFQYTTKIIPLKSFFRISKLLLLMMGGAMMVTAFDKLTMQLMSYNLPDYMFSFALDPLWDSSALLSDRSFLTEFTGYHATPSCLEVVVLICYWGIAFWAFRRDPSTKTFNLIIKNQKM